MKDQDTKLIEKLFKVLIPHDQKKFEDFIAQCKNPPVRKNDNDNNNNTNIPNNSNQNSNKDNLSNENIIYDKKASECITKLRNRWIKIVQPNDIYVRQSRLEKSLEKLKNEIQIETIDNTPENKTQTKTIDLDKLLKQAEQKILEKYLLIVNEYIKTAEGMCHNADQIRHKEKKVAQNIFKNYIIFEKTTPLSQQEVELAEVSVNQLKKRPHIPRDKNLYRPSDAFMHSPDETKILESLHNSVNKRAPNETATALQYGADIFHPNSDGCNAIDLALATISSLSKTASNRENAIEVLLRIIGNFAFRTNESVTQSSNKEHAKIINQLTPILREYVEKYCDDINRSPLSKIYFLGWNYNKVMEQQCSHIKAIIKAIEYGVIKNNPDKAQKILTKIFLCGNNSSQQNNRQRKDKLKRNEELKIQVQKIVGELIIVLDPELKNEIVIPKENKQPMEQGVFVEIPLEEQNKDQEYKFENIKETKSEKKKTEGKNEEDKKSDSEDEIVITKKDEQPMPQGVIEIKPLEKSKIKDIKDPPKKEEKHEDLKGTTQPKITQPQQPPIMPPRTVSMKTLDFLKSEREKEQGKTATLEKVKKPESKRKDEKKTTSPQTSTTKQIKLRRKTMPNKANQEEEKPKHNFEDTEDTDHKRPSACTNPVSFNNDGSGMQKKEDTTQIENVSQTMTTETSNKRNEILNFLTACKKENAEKLNKLRKIEEKRREEEMRRNATTSNAPQQAAKTNLNPK